MVGEFDEDRVIPPGGLLLESRRPGGTGKLICGVANISNVGVGWVWRSVT